MTVSSSTLASVQAGLGPAVAAVFLQPSEFGENLETSTLQNAVNDPQQPPEDLTAQYVSEVQQHMYISWVTWRTHYQAYCIANQNWHCQQWIVLARQMRLAL